LKKKIDNQAIIRISIGIFFIVISIITLCLFLHPIAAIWLGFMCGAFLSFLIILLLEKLIPSWKGPDVDPNFLLNIENKKFYEDDMKVFKSFISCVENLPKDRLPNTNDLSYPVEHIEIAINRLLQSHSLSEAFKKAISDSLVYLEYFKLGDQDK
jgi:hypothetical protein